MRFDLRDKRVLVTGASSGIGKEIARAIAQAGAKLAIASRRRDALEKVADEITAPGGFRPIVLPADLSRRGEAERLAAEAQRALGGVDVLVNNAGVGIAGTQWNVGDSDAAREMMETNYWSPLALTAALVPEMRRRGSGLVVNVASVASEVPILTMGHYASTKAALTLASEALREELHGSGVGVLLVLPGPIETGMYAEVRELPGAAKLADRTPKGDPAVLGRMVVRAIRRGRKAFVYPRSMAVARILPTLARRISFWIMRGKFDLSDPRVVKGGSHGDDFAREARRRFDEQRPVA